MKKKYLCYIFVLTKSSGVGTVTKNTFIENYGGKTVWFSTNNVAL